MIFATLVLLASGLVARADGPTTVPAGDAYSLSPIRVEQLKSSNYLYISSQATYADVGNVIGKSMGQISKDMASLGLSGIAGAPVIVYRGQTMDPSMPFTIDVGFPVTDGTKPAGECKIGHLDAAPAAVTIYTGSMVEFGAAIRDVYSQLIADGHIPADTHRERYLYWEDAQSPNNVVMIEILLRN
jgi:effector-binding domain-containing protein